MCGNADNGDTSRNGFRDHRSRSYDRSVPHGEILKHLRSGPDEYAVSDTHATGDVSARIDETAVSDNSFVSYGRTEIHLRETS
jgi:hypothetical protein